MKVLPPRCAQAQLPPGSPQLPVQLQQHAARLAAQAASPATVIRSQLFDWNQADVPERFDVVLACDVLYEREAVEPIAGVVPRLLRHTSGQLLLADPPTRTAHNRERFLQLAGGAGLGVDECSRHDCVVRRLDRAELAGGDADSETMPDSETIPIQLMVLTRSMPGDTVGLKL